MNTTDKKALLVFRVFMVLIGVMIFFVSIYYQLYLNIHFRNGVTTLGRVVEIQGICSPVVEFRDARNTLRKVSAAIDCEGSTLFTDILVGDTAEVIYDAEKSKYAAILAVHSNSGVHHLENNWKIKNAAFSLFGIGFIVMAFIPKKFK